MEKDLPSNKCESNSRDHSRETGKKVITNE